MPRIITVMIGLLIFLTGIMVVIGLGTFEHNRKVNMYIRNPNKNIFINRVQLFAIPNSHDNLDSFDKIDVPTWYLIGEKMLKQRKEIEDLEYRRIDIELGSISLLAASYVAVMIYSPVLWVAEQRFGNQCQKMVFHALLGSLLLTATGLRVYCFITVKRNYRIITEKAKKVIEANTQAKLRKAIHFCYYGFTQRSTYINRTSDWHHLNPLKHAHLDKVAAATPYCQKEDLEVLILAFCCASLLLQLIVFIRTNRIGISKLEVVEELEAAENLQEPVTDSSSDDFDFAKFDGFGAEGKSFSKKRRPARMSRHGSRCAYAKDPEQGRVLIDAEQFKQLRSIYLQSLKKQRTRSTMSQSQKK